MKLSRSKPRWIAVASIALVLIVGLPVMAHASLNDPAVGTSMTNPNIAPEPYPDGGGAPENEWRHGWGNSLYPEFTWTTIPKANATTPTLGYFYTLTRPQLQSMPTSLSPRYDVTWDPSGTMIDHTLDFQGIYNAIPVPERTYDTTSGQIQHDPREGLWDLNLRFFNESDVATAYSYYAVGLDLTPPRKVMGFTSGVTVPTETTRRRFTWVNTEYDDMSRSAWYELYVNDMKTPVRHIQVVPWMPGTATIENLPSGVNVIGIRVMDRATNQGDMAYVTAVVDSDYPSLSVSPVEGAYVRGTTTFNAAASDGAGVTKVTFSLDGRLKQSSSYARTYSVDTTKLSAGKHTMSVSAYDLFGHVRTVVRTFYVDNVAPSFSSISDSPDPWFPCIQDGYKDVATFRGTVNEFVSDVFCQLYDEDGTTVIAEGHATNVPAGRFYFTCDGRDKDKHEPMNIGPMGTYKVFKWRFSAKDRAGNWRNLPMQTIEVRNYEIVDNPSGGVKVIPR